jgi:hypothetical protein
MLFDLRGRRRRAVQATYLTLALLMGGGLVFFGIGGDVSGGLFDAFSERGGGGSGNEAIEKRIERNEKRAAAGSEPALKELVRDNYQLATSQTASTSTGFPDDAKDELRDAGRWWQRYVKAAEKPDPSLARIAVQIYSTGALEKPKEATEAALIVAEATEDSAAYLQVVQFAALAGDKRTADLAADRAVDLAPRDQRKEVKTQAKALKDAQAQPQAQGG